MGYKKKKNKKTASKWPKFKKKKSKKEKIEFDGVPVVADFGDDDSSSSENVKYDNHRHLIVDNIKSDAINWRNIQILIGTASTTQNNVLIDDYKLQINDKSDAQYTEKSVNDAMMSFGILLSNAKCQSVEFSPNGRYFAVGSQSAEYRIYDRQCLQLIHVRSTNDKNDQMVLQRRQNLKKKNEESAIETNDAFVTCLVWINEQSLAVGNAKGDFLFISTILNEYKVRNLMLREIMALCDREYNVCNEAVMSLDNICEEIQEFVGCDVVDNVIETQFGDRTSCLAAHPYFEMKALPPSPLNASINRKQGLCVCGSWNAVFQGCVLKG